MITIVPINYNLNKINNEDYSAKLIRSTRFCNLSTIASDIR